MSALEIVGFLVLLAVVFACGYGVAILKTWWGGEVDPAESVFAQPYGADRRYPEGGER